MPDSHAQRHRLNDELHQHPYEPLMPPERVIYIAMLVSPEQRETENLHLMRLFEHFGAQLEQGGTRVRHDFGRFRFKMELHQEFTRYKFVFPLDEAELQEPFSGNPLSILPAAWLANLPGEMLIGMDIPLLACPGDATPPPLINQHVSAFTRESLTASQIGRSGGLVMTDFTIRDDGMMRMLVFSRATLPSQNGRLVLRLIEMETYRMLAMLALPEARKLLQKLPLADNSLTKLTNTITRGDGSNDEELLEELGELAAHVEHMVATNYRRLSASRVYFNLMTQRLKDLHEQPVEALPSLNGILSRRLEPARMTCESVSQWLDQLSQRVAQASQLLRTRIDVRHEQQNQELLKAMNNRFQLQLRLQSAAELLSVAIFTYYAVNLLSFIGQELDAAFSLGFDPVMIKGVATPLLAGGALLFIWRTRKKWNIGPQS